MAITDIVGSVTRQLEVRQYAGHSGKSQNQSYLPCPLLHHGDRMLFFFNQIPLAIFLPGERYRVKRWHISTELIAKVLFWVFCFVIFSKISWTNLTVYLPPDGRRDFLVNAHAVWVVAQALVYLPVALRLLQQFNKAVAFWVATTAPYFLIGLWYGQVNFYVVNDLVRYAMPVGFLLFGLWAVKNVPPRTMLTALLVSLSVCVAARTGLHVILADRPMRYGGHWEVLLPVLLVALAYGVKSWRYAAVLAAILATTLSFSFGLTRGTLLGVAAAAGIIGIIALFDPRRTRMPNLRMAAAAGIAIGVAFTPLLFPAQMFNRLSVAGIFADTDHQFLSATFASVFETAPGHERSAEPVPASRPASEPDPDPAESGTRLSPGGPGPVAPMFASPGLTSPEPAFREPAPPGPTSPAEGELSQGGPSLAERRVAAAHERWEHAIAAGNRSMDQRVAESIYFLERMRQDWAGLLLGAGAGTYVMVAYAWEVDEVAVRGAHNTPVTMLYRHGLILGTLLFLFVAFYGLRTNIRQMTKAESFHWRAILIALVAYRVTAIGMAQLHQGLFDDPVVFLAIAVAIAIPVAETPGTNPARRLPSARA